MVMAVCFPWTEAQNEPFASKTQPSRDDMAMVSDGTSAAAFSTPKRIPVRFLQRFAFI
jgi:hypothetical protein